MTAAFLDAFVFNLDFLLNFSLNQPRAKSYRLFCESSKVAKDIKHFQIVFYQLQIIDRIKLKACCEMKSNSCSKKFNVLKKSISNFCEFYLLWKLLNRFQRPTLYSKFSYNDFEMQFLVVQNWRFEFHLRQIFQGGSTQILHSKRIRISRYKRGRSQKKTNRSCLTIVGFWRQSESPIFVRFSIFL